jgi:hypothetical protein
MNKSILKRFYTKYNNKYPGLLPNERFLLMEYVKNKHYHQFINDRIPLFNRLLSLNKNINLLKAIKTIYVINEIPWEKKISLIINRLISILCNLR